MAPQGRILLASLLLLGGLLSVTPTATAAYTSPVETFEDDTAFFPQPCDRNTVTGVCKTSPFYTMLSSTTGYVVASPGNPGKSFTNDGSGGGFLMYQDPCNLPSTGISTVEFDYRLTAYPGAGNHLTVGWIDSSGASFAYDFGLAISDTGLPSVVAETIANAGGDAGVAFAGATVLSLNTWYHVVISVADGSAAALGCGSSGSDVAVTISGTGYGPFGNHISNFASTAAYTANSRGIATRQVNGAFTVLSAAPQHYFDNLQYTTPVALAAEGTPGLRFCAVAAEDNFGFDYKEDVTFDDDGDPVNGIGLDDFYDFSEDTGGSSYLGKGFNPGSKSFATLGRIEAADEGQTSVFRFAYTTGATTLTAGSAGDGGADMTASGNGQTTGNFANNVQLELTESGDDWIARIRYSVAGGALTTIGAAVLLPDPNTATLFNFTVDSTNGPSGTGDGAAWVRDDTGALLFSRDLPSGLQDVTWKDAWFIGTADAGLANTKAALDNNDVGDASGSTCIYDLIGTATTTGSSGSEPGGSGGGSSSSSTSCSSVLCVDSTTVPEGFTVEAFNGFLGIIFLIIITVGVLSVMYGGKLAGVSGAVVGIVAACVYIMGLFFGLLPLWPIVAAVVISAAIVFIRMRTGA